MVSEFPVLAEHLLDKHSEENNGQELISLTDSMPIITCSGSRIGKVARELCDKGSNSTKKMYYFCVKLHGIGFYPKEGLPVMEFIQLSPASKHALQAQLQLLQQIPTRAVFADKAFCNKNLKGLFSESRRELFTLVKHKKGQALEDKKRHKAGDNLYSRAVSIIRQSIEFFFSSLIQHTHIQRGAKVRLLKGLPVHVFGRIAASLVKLQRI
jgi:hypothetical protein